MQEMQVWSLGQKIPWILKSGPGNRGRSACGPTHVARLEFPRETGLILRCAGNLPVHFTDWIPQEEDKHMDTIHREEPLEAELAEKAKKDEGLDLEGQTGEP